LVPGEKDIGQEVDLVVTRYLNRGQIPAGMEWLRHPPRWSASGAGCSFRAMPSAKARIRVCTAHSLILSGATECRLPS